MEFTTTAAELRQLQEDDRLRGQDPHRKDIDLPKWDAVTYVDAIDKAIELKKTQIDTRELTYRELCKYYNHKPLRNLRNQRLHEFHLRLCYTEVVVGEDEEIPPPEVYRAAQRMREVIRKRYNDAGYTEKMLAEFVSR